MRQFALDADAPLHGARGLQVEVPRVRIAGGNLRDIVECPGAPAAGRPCAQQQRRRGILVRADHLREEERQVLIELAAALARVHIGDAETGAEYRLAVGRERISQARSRGPKLFMSKLRRRRLLPFLPAISSCPVTTLKFDQWSCTS